MMRLFLNNLDAVALSGVGTGCPHTSDFDSRHIGLVAGLSIHFNWMENSDALCFYES
jgi:hypothetical protein